MRVRQMRNFGGKVFHSHVAVLTSALVLSLSPAISSVNAGIIDISASQENSTTGQGNFTGTLEYFAEDSFSTVGTLIVTLTNTTDSSLGGWLTGFLFDINTVDAEASAKLLWSPNLTHPFKTAKGEGLKGYPFGWYYDGGAALGWSYGSNVDPSNGIAVGETGVFKFDIFASDAGLLDAIDFILGGDYEFNFITRFRGLNSQVNSDKVPAATVAVMPLPAPFALGAIGLLGMIGYSRRLRKSH